MKQVNTSNPYAQAMDDRLIADDEAQIEILKAQPTVADQAVTATPEAIITTNQTDRMASCKATLVIHGHTGLAAFSFTTGGATTDPTLQIPIQYTVEMTDDGQLSVTVYGLR